jgi:glutaredoxin
MRNLLIIIALAFGAYKGYDHYAEASTIAYDEQGNPLTLVFTIDRCGKYCDNAIALLNKRNIDFIEYNISESEDNADLMKKYGGKRTLPYVVTGNRKLTGFEKNQWVAMLAEVHGWDALTRKEQKLLRNNFDDSGSPIIVMYSDEKCGYCQKAKAYFESEDVAYVERDIKKDRSAYSDYKALQGNGTPLIYVGYRRVNGFNERALDEALELL